MVRLWVWSSAGMAHHGVTSPWYAVPVSTLACLAGLVLAGLRAVCLLSGRFSAEVWLVPSCVSRLMVSLSVVVARPLRFSSVHPPVPHWRPGVLCLLYGAVSVLVPAGQSPWLGTWGAGLAVCLVVSCLAGPVVCASVPQCGWRRLGWPGLVARGLASWCMIFLRVMRAGGLQS